MNIFLMIILIILGVSAVVLSVLLITKSKLKIEVKKESGKSVTTKISVELLGGLIKKNISALKTNGKKSKKQSETSPDETTKKKSGSFYRNFEKIKYIFQNSKHKLRKKIRIDKLRLFITFGLDDAAHTGIAIGSLWAGVYNVIAFLGHICILREPEIKIEPDFENEKLAFDGECIIILRLANIISILYIIAINYFTLKNKKKAAINYGNTD